MKLILLTLAFCVCAYSTPTPGYFPAYQNGLERIVGGQAAARNQFPYQISLEWVLLILSQHVCGGSIISPNRIVTAAHCITETPSIGSLRVRAGILLLNENVATLQTITVQSSAIHPNYAGGVAPDDIAVLRLGSSLALGSAVAQINLPVAGSIPTGVAVLSGWGATNAAGNQIPNQLQFANKPIMTINECANALTSLLGSAGPLAQSNVCTGAPNAGVSACSGDSGGPLAQGNTLIGVVSWGIMPCGTIGAPSVFTNGFLDRSSSNTRDYQLRTSNLHDVTERFKDLRSRGTDRTRFDDERQLYSREAFRNFDDREGLDRNNNIVRWRRITPDRSSRSVDVRDSERNVVLSRRNNISARTAQRTQNFGRLLESGCPKPTLTDNLLITQRRNEKSFQQNNRFTSGSYGSQQLIKQRYRRGIQQDDSSIIRRQLLETSRNDRSRFSSMNDRLLLEQRDRSAYKVNRSNKLSEIDTARERTSASRTNIKEIPLSSSKNRSTLKRSDRRYYDRNVRDINSNVMQRRTSETRSDRNERFAISEIALQSRRNRIITSSSRVIQLRLSQNEDNSNSHRFNRHQIGNDREFVSTSTPRRISRMNGNQRSTTSELTDTSEFRDRNSRNSERLEERTVETTKRLLKTRVDRERTDRRSLENRRTAEIRKSRNSEVFDERSLQTRNRDFTGREYQEREMKNIVRNPNPRTNQIERRTSSPVTDRRSSENRYTDAKLQRYEDSKTIRDRRLVEDNLEENTNRNSNSARSRTHESRFNDEAPQNRVRYSERRAIDNFEERREVIFEGRTTRQVRHFSQRILQNVDNRNERRTNSEQRREILNLENERRSNRIGETRSAQRTRRTGTTNTRNELLTESRRSQNMDAASTPQVRRYARSLGYNTGKGRTYSERIKPEIMRKQTNKLVPAAIQFRNDHMLTKMEQKSISADRTALKRQQLESEVNSKSRRPFERINERQRNGLQSIELVNRRSSIEKRTSSEQKLSNSFVTFDSGKHRTDNNPSIFLSSKPSSNDSPVWLNITKMIFLSISIIQILCASDPKLFSSRNKFMNIFTFHKEKVQ
ncbi:hypothetical protein Trydic_g3498 [Trypoxylus dichotomus]